MCPKFCYTLCKRLRSGQAELLRMRDVNDVVPCFSLGPVVADRSKRNFNYVFYIQKFTNLIASSFCITVMAILILVLMSLLFECFR